MLIPRTVLEHLKTLNKGASCSVDSKCELDGSGSVVSKLSDRCELDGSGSVLSKLSDRCEMDGSGLYCLNFRIDMNWTEVIQVILNLRFQQNTKLLKIPASWHVTQ